MQGLQCQVQSLGSVHRVLGSHGRTLSRAGAGQLWGPAEMNWRLGGQGGGWDKGSGERVRPEPGLSGRKGGNRIESLDTRDRAGDRCGEERGKEALTSTHRPLL